MPTLDVRTNPAAESDQTKRKTKGWKGNPSSSRTRKSPPRASKPARRGRVQANCPKPGVSRHPAQFGIQVFPDFGR